MNTIYRVFYSTFLSKATRFPKGNCIPKVPRLRPFVFLVKATCRLSVVGSVREIVATGERRTVPVTFCVPQILHGLARDRNRAFAVKGR